MLFVKKFIFKRKLFIEIKLSLFSRCKIGQLNGNEEGEAMRKPGVYFR